MQTLSNKAIKSAVGGTGASLALLLALVAPALASSGIDSLCTHRAEQHATTDDHELMLEVVDHGPVETLSEAAPVEPPVPGRITESTILRRIFDEAPPASSEPEADSGEDGLETLPPISEPSADASETEAADGLVPVLRLPDASDEDMLRYRREMFRTDI